jgi:hypothetical protein
MSTNTLDSEAVRSVLAAERIPLPPERLGPMTEAVRAYRAMADLLHRDLPMAAEPAGLEIPVSTQTRQP